MACRWRVPLHLQHAAQQAVAKQVHPWHCHLHTVWQHTNLSSRQRGISGLQSPAGLLHAAETAALSSSPSTQPSPVTEKDSEISHCIASMALARGQQDSVG